MPSPSSSRRSSDSEVFFSDWDRHRQQGKQPRRASAQPQQSNHQYRRRSQPRDTDAWTSASASAPQMLSDAQYRNLLPHLNRYREADAYLAKAEGKKQLYEQLIRAAKARCRDGTMTAHTASLFKAQMQNAYYEYQAAMSQFGPEVVYINTLSSINGRRIETLPDDASSNTSSATSMSNNGRRISNAGQGNRYSVASHAAVEQKKEHHRLSRMFHRS